MKLVQSLGHMLLSIVSSRWSNRLEEDLAGGVWCDGRPWEGGARRLPRGANL